MHKQIMVDDWVDGWTPFLRNLIDLVEELEELGVVYANNQASYIERLSYE